MIEALLPGERAIWLVKAVHIAAIAIWSGGLVSLPVLMLRRRGLTGEAVHDLHRIVRYLHVEIVSPAAFVAVIAGMALIFMREIFFVWFIAKLYFVAVLVACHLGLGQMISRTFLLDRPMGRVTVSFTIVAALIGITGVLFFVLAKPILSLTAIAGEAAEPGWLEDSVVGPLISLLISPTK